ncbi:hypothetical protein RJ641_013906 [Dillenia turbinata]|uniref:Uncharacterized protein n=1 Tax=Dillenia turbinata TaxID=194707 RepID=A0AAN8WHZ0_9MAGN
MSTKKPVVMESYDEIVFLEPSDTFFSRLHNHPAVNVPRLPAGFSLPSPVPIEDANKRKRGDTKDNPLGRWFTNFSEADELLKLAAARQQESNKKIFNSHCINLLPGFVHTSCPLSKGVQAHIAKLRRQLSVLDGQQQQFKSTSDQ